MTQPLALVWFGRLLLATRLTERLEALGYRVQEVDSPESLAEQAEHAKPLLVIVGMDSQPDRTTRLISGLRDHPATAHLPVIAIVSGANQSLREPLLAAGAKLAVPDAVALEYLDQFLQQALDLD